MIDVIPAIIPARYRDIEPKVSRVAGLVQMVQIDIVDGAFAPVRTWPFNRTPDEDFTALLAEEHGLPEWESVDYELDMMVMDPERMVEDWARAGVSAMVFHVESRGDLALAIEKARGFDIEVGLALNPSTPTDSLEQWTERIDFVQFMGSDALGRQGLALDPRVCAKVSECRASHPDMPIAIDIGVNEETAPELVDAGATRLVSGSALFESTDIAATIEYFSNLG